MVIDVSLENMDLLPEVLRVPAVEGVYLPSQRMAPENWPGVAQTVRQAGKHPYLSLPFVLRQETGEYFRKNKTFLAEADWEGYLVRSLDEAAFLEAEDLPGKRIFDAGMYVWNREAVSVMRSLGAGRLTFPYECREQEIRELGFEDMELVVYGRIPLMISAQCTANTRGECRKKAKDRSRGKDPAGSWMDRVDFRYLTDRRNAVFPEDSHCRFCTSVIYNSVPLWLLDRIPGECRYVRFLFTDEKPGEAFRILQDFTEGKTAPSGAFTRGHFTRGVE